MSRTMHLTHMQDRVLGILNAHGPLTGDELVEKYREKYGHHAAPAASIRSRRSELTAMGHVTRAGESTSLYGNPTPLWAVQDTPDEDQREESGPQRFGQEPQEEPLPETNSFGEDTTPMGRPAVVLDVDTLSTLIEGADKWADELAQYIIPEAAPEDAEDYQHALDQLNRSVDAARALYPCPGNAKSQLPQS